MKAKLLVSASAIAAACLPGSALAQSAGPAPKQGISTPNAAEAIGPYAQGIRAGNMVFLAGQILDSGVNDSSRLIRTGLATTASGYTADDYRGAICTKLFGLFDCADHAKLRIKVTEIGAGTFASAAPTAPIDPNCSMTGQCDLTITETYEPGVGSSVVLVEAYYKWPTIVNLPMFDLATMPDGTRLLSAVRVFRNEPF